MEDIKITKIKEEAGQEIPEERKTGLWVTNKVMIVVIVVLFLLFSSAVGVYGFFQEYTVHKLEKNALSELEAGDYTAALSLYKELEKSSGDDDGAAVEKIEQVKKLLVAEEIYKKARQAAEKEEWLDVEVLLKDSEAIINREFKSYEESLALFQKAQEILSSYEEQIADTISALKQNIVSEETRRKQAEESKAQTESELGLLTSQKHATDQALQTTQQQLDETQNQAEQNRIKLEQEQQRARELELQAQKEQLEKFNNEMSVYVGMLDKGNGLLNSAISEIERNSDISSLIYISQAKVLFDEATEKAGALKINRTPTGFDGTVNKLMESSNLFNSAAGALRNSVVFIESKNGEEFANYFNQAKNLKLQAYSLLNEVR